MHWKYGKEFLNVILSFFFLRRSFDLLPFYLGVYSYSAGLGQPAFTGLDMRFQYSAFSRLRYLTAGCAQLPTQLV